MHNRLGLLLVLAFFAHAIASVAYAATIDDPKGQAVWLAVPLMLTPSWLFDMLPTITGPKSHSTWYLQTIVRYPVGFAFTSILLYIVGFVLQRFWHIGFRSAVAVGAFIGLWFGALWFMVTANHPAGYSVSWFALGIVGALLSALIYRKHEPLTLHSTGPAQKAAQAG